MQRFRGGLVFKAHRLLYQRFRKEGRCLAQRELGRSIRRRIERPNLEPVQRPRRPATRLFSVWSLLRDWGLLSNEYGTYTTVKAIFWPWLSGKKVKIV